MVTSSLINKLESISQDMKFHINSCYGADESTMMDDEDLNEYLDIRNKIKILCKKLKNKTV